MAERTLSKEDFLYYFESNQVNWGSLLQNSGNPIVWEKLFFERFGEAPKPGTNEPNHFRYGSTDPRWDLFLHDEKALRIITEILTEAKKKAVR